MSGELKFPDEIYVAFQGRDKAKFPAAYAVPNENTAASKKQKENADNWATFAIFDKQTQSNKWYKGISEIFKNEPIEGFEIASFTSRYSTDNKVFRVRDPRGFTLEIYADNLVDLIKNSTIINGVIQGKKLWARTSAGKWFLSPDDDRDYLHKLKPAVTRTKLRPGDKYNERGSEKIYLGDFYIAKVQNICDYNTRTYNIGIKKHIDPKSITYNIDNSIIDDNMFTKTLISKSSKKYSIYEEDVDLQNLLDHKGQVFDWQNEWIIEGYPHPHNVEFMRIFKTRDELDMYIPGNPDALYDILKSKYFG